MQVCNALDNDGHLFWYCFSPFCGTSQQPRVSSLDGTGPHQVASLFTLAWLASWIDFTFHWDAMGCCCW